MIKITLLLLWIIVSSAEGCRDGHFYHNRMTATNPDKQNIHWIYFLERFIVLTLIYWVIGFTKSNAVFIISLSMIFSLIHNGVYFVTRHKLDSNQYPKGFFSNSTSSEATLEFNVVARIFMAITGVMGIIASLII